ncbi:MAG: N-6 DNA methylase [Candidatus Lokiarchaeota archaeon]|nr:N-6 DNA methylase [Candidatus Lokiarchaeota archaeon]
MNRFGIYLNEKHVLKKFIKYYHINEPELKLLNEIVRELVKINGKDLKPSLFGEIYEKIVNSENRKHLGEFYTPEKIACYIMNAVGYVPGNDLEVKSLIDFGCGAGSFLIEATKILILHWKIKFNIKSHLDISIVEAKKIIENVRENIEGIEINPLAAILCQLSMQLILFDLYELIIALDKEYSLPEFKIYNASIFEKELFRQYDFVVGNPPYLFIRDIPVKQKMVIENLNFETRKGQYDYYQLFIEIGIKLLKEGGYLGYIVPDSLLTLSNKRIIRQYMFSHTKIKEIFHTGPKFNHIGVSNTIIILEKESREHARKNNEILIKLESNSEVDKKNLNQKQLINWNYDFLIHLGENDYQILAYLNNNFPKLGELILSKNYTLSLSRGVELGKEGIVVYCSSCGCFIPFPKKKTSCKNCGNSNLNLTDQEKIVVNKIPENNQDHYKPYIFSLNQYSKKKKKYINISKKGINYKPLEIYQDSIVIRQICQNNRICAAYNQESSLTSQSIYNLRISHSPIPEFNIYYLLGLINSMLMSYFFIKSFGSYKKMFPRILIEKIRSLPIKIPRLDREKELAERISQEVIYILKSDTSDEQKESMKYIDELVMDLYDIPAFFKVVIQDLFS